MGNELGVHRVLRDLEHRRNRRFLGKFPRRVSQPHYEHRQCHHLKKYFLSKLFLLTYVWKKISTFLVISCSYARCARRLEKGRNTRDLIPVSKVLINAIGFQQVIECNENFLTFAASKSNTVGGLGGHDSLRIPRPDTKAIRPVKMTNFCMMTLFFRNWMRRIWHPWYL